MSKYKSININKIIDAQVCHIKYQYTIVDKNYKCMHAMQVYCFFTFLY